MKIDFCQLKERDSNPPFVFQDWRDAEFSRPPRYDHFDNPPKNIKLENCEKTARKASRKMQADHRKTQ